MFGNKAMDEMKADFDAKLKTIEESVLKVQETLDKHNEHSVSVGGVIKQYAQDTVQVKLVQKAFSEHIEEEMSKVVDVISGFEKSMASFDNVKNRLDTLLYDKINEFIDRELASIRKKLGVFDDVEDRFKALVGEVTALKMELAKFNAIAGNIKEVDFSLHKHAKELELQDKTKIDLERENDRLKSIMAKMKRQRG